MGILKIVKKSALFPPVLWIWRHTDIPCRPLLIICCLSIYLNVRRSSWWGGMSKPHSASVIGIGIYISLIDNLRKRLAKTSLITLFLILEEIADDPSIIWKSTSCPLLLVCIVYVLCCKEFSLSLNLVMFSIPKITLISFFIHITACWRHFLFAHDGSWIFSRAVICEPTLTILIFSSFPFLCVSNKEDEQMRRTEQMLSVFTRLIVEKILTC